MKGSSGELPPRERRGKSTDRRPGEKEPLPQTVHYQSPRPVAPLDPALASPSSPTLPSWMKQGEGIPGYEIQEKLGRGGMGVVYRAWQVRLKRTVALKMILVGTRAGAEDRERFSAEAEAIARLQHPNIIQIYDVGEHHGLPYFAMEFAPDDNLAKKLQGRPLSPQEIARFVETLARAVHHAHQRGIIHRDLKPGNVLLVRSDPMHGFPLDSPAEELAYYLPKISDFGLAKQFDPASESPQSGTIVGTPSYMAPEQAGGGSREISPATDVYALGAILYELLTGRPPFPLEGYLDTLQKVLSEHPTPPSQLRPEVPGSLEAICLKCLHKDPGERYPSAEALAEDLRSFAQGELIGASPIQGKKRGSVLALVLFSGLLALFSLFGAYWQWLQPKTASGGITGQVNPSPPKAPAPPPVVPKDFQQIVAATTETIRQNPEDATAYLQRGLAYYYLGNYPQVIADCNQVLRYEPQNALAYAYRAGARMEEKELDEARVDCTEALRLDPGCAAAHAFQGMLSYQNRDYDRAIAACNEALRYEPREFLAYLFRGRSYLGKGDTDQAIEDFTRAIQLQRRLAVGYYHRGSAFHRKKDYDQAAADYTEAIRWNPQSLESYFYRGMVYQLKGERDKAIADFTKAIRVNPDFAPAHMNRGMAYREKEEYDKAITDFTQALNLNPQDGIAYCYRGWCYLQKKEYDLAIADLTGGILLEPKNFAAYNHRGLAHLGKKEYDEAIADFTQAIRLNPQYSPAYANRGLAYAGKGDPAKARADFKEAARLGQNVQGL